MRWAVWTNKDDSENIIEAPYTLIKLAHTLDELDKRAETPGKDSDVRPDHSALVPMSGDVLIITSDGQIVCNKRSKAVDNIEIAKSFENLRQTWASKRVEKGTNVASPLPAPHEVDYQHYNYKETAWTLGKSH